MKLNRKNLANRLGSLFICVAALVSMASCQANPEESIIKNKDLDKLIEQAQNPDTNSVGMDDLVGKCDIYKTVLSDDKLGVTVNVDAKVDIPKAEKLSVMRVEQAPITQEQLDTLRKALVGDTPLYDGVVLRQQTKKDIEQEIAGFRVQIDEMKKTTEYNTQKEIDDYCRDMQGRIDALQVKYESAPDKVVLDKYPSDGNIKTISEMFQAHPDIYEYENDLIPDGSIFDAVGTYDGEYISLRVQNSENWSNDISFFRDSVGVHVSNGVMIRDSVLWRKGEPVQSSMTDNNGEPISGDIHPTDKVTLSLNDAVAKANDFLTNVGLDAFKYYEGDRYYECISYSYTPEEDGKSIYSEKFSQRDYYVLTYTRVIDNAPTTPGGGKNSLAGYTGTDSNVTKKQWNTEKITIKINDSGIVGFQLDGQLEIKDTVVESTSLKSFDDIKSTFEQMVLISNASKYGRKTIDINRVTLGYALVSEQNSYDTGLLIPVWDFFGTSETYDESGNEIYKYGSTSQKGVIFTVNAIDGSIIDRALGY